MSNFEITFGKLKELTTALQRGNDKRLVEYLNSFEGDDIYEKFRNVIISWENGVAYSLNLKINDTPTQVHLSYLISEFPSDLGGNVIWKEGDVEIHLGIPSEFSFDGDIIPIYDVIKYINICGISIDLTNLSSHDRKTVINSLPPKVYTMAFNSISKDKSKISKFTNPSLKNFQFNFFTNEPYLFLKGLFSNYSEDYFRDIIYHLSHKVDGKLLMGSTPLDIEYYIDKFSKEV